MLTVVLTLCCNFYYDFDEQRQVLLLILLISRLFEVFWDVECCLDLDQFHLHNKGRVDTLSTFDCLLQAVHSLNPNLVPYMQQQ